MLLMLDNYYFIRVLINLKSSKYRLLLILLIAIIGFHSATAFGDDLTARLIQAAEERGKPEP